MSSPSAALSLCAQKNPLEVAFLVLFWRTKKNEAFVLQYLPSDKKIFRVLTGSCRGGIMESRRGEKTFKIYPPSARRTHHRDKVLSIPAVVAEERSATTASHRKIFLSDGTRSILALDHSPCRLSTTHQRQQHPAPRSDTSPPRSTHRQGSTADSRAPLPRAAGQARPSGAAAPPPRGCMSVW